MSVPTSGCPHLWPRPLDSEQNSTRQGEERTANGNEGKSAPGVGSSAHLPPKATLGADVLNALTTKEKKQFNFF